MAFLYPAFLLGALAVAIPIVLHLLRRDVAPDVPFSAVRLLKRSPIERSKRRRLRDLLLLAARVAALVLLAAAFARPYFAADATPAPLRIVAVDRSFSMGAPGRFARAQELARAAIREGSGDRVALITFDERAQVVFAPGARAEAESAVNALDPGSGSTRFAPAIAAAIDLADGGPARLIIVTDLQRSGWEDEHLMPVPAAIEVDVRDVGEAPANIGITQISVAADRVTASLRNTGSSPFSGRIRLLQDDREAASADVTVPAAGAVDVPILHRAAPKGSLSVAVDDRVGYPADNVRYAVLDPAPRPRVLVVGTDASAGVYLSRALAIADADDAYEVRPVSGIALSGIPQDELAGYSAIVLLSTRGLDRRGREGLLAFVRRGGGGLLVAASSDLDPGVLAGTMGWPQFSAREQQSGAALSVTDLRHPIFRPFGALAANLGHVRFDRAWRLRADDWEVAARFTDGAPALVERRDAGGRVVVFASDLDRRWNDFPLHPSFVPFAIETIRYVAGERPSRRDYLVADAPAGARPAPGVYTADRDRRLVAVNADPRESGAERLTPEEFLAMLQRVDAPVERAREVQARQTESQQNLWRYGVMLMLIVLVGESLLGRA